MATVLDTLLVNMAFRTNLTGLRRFERTIRSTQARLDSFAAGAFKMGLALTAAFVGPIKAASDWETAFTGVRKTVNASEEEFAKLEAQLREIARTEVPLSHTELAQIAEAAGQLGIENKNILDFVKVMAKLGVTTNLTSDAAATMLARFANIMGMDQTNFERLGSTIVDLGNNFATTEAEITTLGLRLAGAGKTVGLTEPQILAFAATLSSLGVEAEAGGTALSRVLLKMNEAVVAGGDELVTFSKTAGVSTQEFARLFKDDATTAVLSFLDGVRRMNENGENTAAVFKDIRLKGFRITDVLLRSSGALDLMRDALGQADKAWGSNTALTKEAELRFKTFESQAGFLKNELFDLGIEVGSILLPMLRELVQWARPLIRDFSLWAAENPTLVKTLAILGPTLLAAAAAAKVLSLALGAYVGITTTITVLTAAMRALGLSMAFFTLTNPVMLGIAALAAAGLLIYTNWEPLVAFFTSLTEKIAALGKEVRKYFGITESLAGFGASGLNALPANAFGENGPNLPAAPAPQGLFGENGPNLPVAPAPQGLAGFGASGVECGGCVWSEKYHREYQRNQHRNPSHGCPGDCGDGRSRTCRSFPKSDRTSGFKYSIMTLPCLALPRRA